jgi:hypothetical protein
MKKMDGKWKTERMNPINAKGILLTSGVVIGILGQWKNPETSPL